MNYDTLTYDPEKIKAAIKQAIQINHQVTRLNSGTFSFTTYWKRGELKKAMVDDMDITRKVNIETTADLVNDILKMSKRYRNDYSGSQRFVVEVERGEISKIVRVETSTILSNNKNRTVYGKSH